MSAAITIRILLNMVFPPTVIPAGMTSSRH
jgi:hypothetical protein